MSNQQDQDETALPSSGELGRRGDKISSIFLNVTRDEFAELKNILTGLPEQEYNDSMKVIDFLGLDLSHVAFKELNVRVVDVVDSRISEI